MMLGGRRVVITGVGGIGEQVARQALSLGAHVHLVDREAGTLARLADELSCGFTVCDLRDDARVDHSFRAAAAALGGVDGLVAVAGGSGRSVGDGPIDTLTAAALEATLAINLTPAVLALGAFLRHRDPDAASSTVLIGSVLARRPHPLFATHAYAAAKAAIEGVALAAAAHFASQGASINVVSPGLTRTPMSARAQGDDETLRFARSRQPLADDGFVDAADVAAVSCALIANTAVTGQVVAVDAGWSVR